MNRRRLYLTLFVWPVILLGLTVSCYSNKRDMDAEYANTPMGNFTSLWTIMDRNYCFFDYKKQELGVDWDEVFDRYSKYISDGMGNRALFEVLCQMLAELRDGHVNLVSSYDVGRSWHIKSDYAANFSEDVRSDYLGTDYVIAGNGYYYRILIDNVGYLAVTSFESRPSDSRLNTMFLQMMMCNGLIIDVRNNGGGNSWAAEDLASRFTEKRVLTGYSCYKNGPGHNDFSKLEENWLEPDMYNIRWNKPVVVLTNRGCYSTTNEFVNIMRYLPNVTLLGDTTGGGGGLPFTGELPNGWTVRFSSAPSFDASMEHIESGVAPDIRLDMDPDDIKAGTDTYIERAVKLINDRIVNP